VWWLEGVVEGMVRRELGETWGEVVEYGSPRLLKIVLRIH